MGSFLSKFVSAFDVRQRLVARARLPNDSLESGNHDIHLNAIELEARVLYSASPLNAESFGQSELNSDLDFATLEDAFFPEHPAATEFAFPLTGEEDSGFEFVLGESPLLDSLDPLTVANQYAAQELVFVDTNVDDWQQLLNDLTSNRLNQNISFVLLDADRDGIEQMSETLSQHTDLAAIHLISHGTDSQLNLGSTTLTNQNINAYAGELTGWRDALADGADLLIYGCDLASTDSGRELVEGLSALCNCDVAASDDLTGHDSLGGDWDLEYAVGVVDTDLVFSANLQAEWFSVLTVTATNGNFPINDTTSDVQKNVDVIIQDDGSSVAVFDSLNDGSGEGVYFRLIDPSGTPTGTDVLVNQTTLNQQVDPAIARDGAGNFVVTWTSTQSGSMDVYARMFTSAGTPLTNEILVNTTYTTGEQQDSAVAMDDAGNFVVTWEGEGNDAVKGADSKGIWAQRFDSSGTPVGDTFLVHDTATPTTEDNPAIAMDFDGDFVITWTDRSGGNPEIHAQRFDSLANPLGQFVVQSSLDGEADLSSVAMDDAGNFVVAWSEKNADPSQFGVKMRSFNAAGTPRSGDVLVNTTTSVDQLDPDISMDSDGDYVISWTSTDQDGDAKGVFARAYFANGTPDGGEIGPVNTYTTSDQHVSAASLNNSGQFTVVWEGESAADAAGVYGQLYSWPDAIATGTVADNFDDGAGGSSGYTGNDGTLNWIGDWTETGDTNNRINVVDKNGGGDWRLLLQGDGSVKDYYVSRLADLSGSTFATLTYDYEQVNSYDAEFAVEIRDGDTGWTEVAYYMPAGGGATGSESISIAANLRDNGNTELRFLSPIWTDPEFLYIDNIQIEHDGSVGNSPPTDIAPNAFNVDENVNTSGGFSLGTLTTTDPNTGESFTYSILPGGDGPLFTIGGAESDQLILDDGVLDFETKSSYTVNLRVTDSFGSTYDETITVNVNDINESPVLGNNRLTITEGQTVTFDGSMLAATDVDSSDPDLTLNVSNVAGGYFELLSNIGVPIFSFDQSEVTASQIRFVSTSSDAPSYDIDVSDGSLADGPHAAEIVFARNAVWLTTTADVGEPNDTDGVQSWGDSTVLELSDPNFSLESATTDTDGTFYSMFDVIDDFAAETSTQVTGLHLVSRDLTVNGFTVLAGDILFAVNGASPDMVSTNDPPQMQKNDIMRFRPDTPGDYTSGEFEIIVDNIWANDLSGISLVEQDMWIGDFQARAGDFLIAEGKSGSADIYYYGVTSGVPSSTPIVLIEGATIGSDKVTSIHLVADSVTVGDVDLVAGNILVTQKAAVTGYAGIGSTVNPWDVVALNVTTTGIGSTAATGTVVFEGADAGLNSSAEAIEAFTLVSASSFPTNRAPTDIAPNSFNINETIDTTGGYNLGTLTATDPDPLETFTWNVIGGADMAAFSVGGAGFDELIFDESLIDDGMIDFEDRDSYSVIVEVTDSDLNTYSETIAISVNDLNHVLVVDTAMDVQDGNVSSIGALLDDRGADGFVSLREAIVATNNTINEGGSADQILFNITDGSASQRYYTDDGVAGSVSLGNIADASILGGEGFLVNPDPDHLYTWFQIDLDNALPQLSISEAVTIEGYSQWGASENTLAVGSDAVLRIEVTNSAGNSNYGFEITSTGGGSTINGLVINDFGAAAIMVQPGADGNAFQGNYIGTDVTGTIGIANQEGIHLRSSGNLVGGPDPGDRNVLSDNNSRGVVTYTFAGNATGNVVQGNYIGVDSSGLVGLGNGGTAGIQVYNQDGMQILDNVISGNTGDGINFLTGGNAVNTVIQENLIGVGADGTTIIANDDGIRIESDSATGTQIGGTSAGQENVIAGNRNSGIVLTGAGVTTSTIVGNFIGTDLSGLLDWGNVDHGILIENASFGNMIGGTTLAAGNSIAFNNKDGVALKSDAGNGNAILGNSIYENDGLGIDLNDDNETDNDNFDIDVGANTRINFPVISSAVTDGVGNITVSGWFNTVPGVASYRLEFFVSPTADPGGNGEGQTFIGFIDVNTDANGVAIFNQTFGATVAIGEVISATATDSSQNTSEFSIAFAAHGLSNATTDGIWLSTENDVTASGATGLSDWTDGEVVSFGGPGLLLDPVTTSGNFASVFNLDSLGDGDVDIDGIHYVTQNVMVGSGINSINLVAGDVLITTAADESFFGGTFDVMHADLFLFRPIVAGDYSVGTMQLVLDMDSPTLSVPAPDPDLSFNDMWSVSLVEQDTAIGGYNLFAGEILFTRDGGAEDNDVYVFHVTDVGAGVTDGTADKLIDGDALGFASKIYGLDIVESTIAVGDEILPLGSLLISIENDTTILDADIDPANDLAIQRHDIVSIEISQTEMNGGTVGDSAYVIFEGADVSFDDPDENIDAFAILSSISANAAPELSGIEGTNASYTENGAPTQITNTISISDVDDTQIDSATIQITGNFTAGDELLFADTATITHSWDSVTGTLTLSGGDSLANYIAALQSVTFENTGDDPTAATRTISITVNDGDDDSNTLNRDIDVTPINDAPVVSVDPTNLPYASGAVAIDPLLTVTDVDNTQLLGATVRFGAGYINGEDTFVFVDQLGITGSFNAGSGTLTLTGTASVADYQTALRSVQYEDVNPTPTVGTLRVRFSVDDGTDVSAWDRRTIDVVDDEPPRASDDSDTVAEGGTVIIDLAGNDSDNNNLLDLSTVVIKSGPSDGSLVDNLDGTFTYTHNGSETLSDSFSYTIKDDLGLESNEATVSVTVTPVNDDPIVSGPVSDGGTEDDAVFAVDLLAGASDAEGNTLNVSGLTLSSGDDSGVTIGVNSLSVDPNAYNALAVGESEVITYSYNIIDGIGGSVAQTATITITGQNDGPTVSGVVTDGGTEDDAVFAVDLLAGAADDDTTDTLNVSGLTLSSGDDSGVTVGVNSLSIDPNAYNSLAVGESAVIVYTYNIIDGEGGSVAQTATITITGENDGPTVSGVVTDGGTEDDAVFAVDLLNGASDADTTDVLNVSGLTLSSGDDSGVTIGVNSLSVDPNAYNSLAVGESEVIVYSYNIIDGEGGSVVQTATITITGENDGPTVSGVITDGGTEDDAVFAVDLLNGASDADTTDVLIVSGLTLSSGDDSGVTIGVNILSIDPNAYNSLAVGESEVIVYNYNIFDGEGGSVAQTATITITGENDGPTVSGVVTDGGTEDDAVFAVDLLNGASDADTTDVLNVSGSTLSSGDDSGVTIGVNSLSVDPNAYNSLAVGESEVIVYSYTIIDGEGGSVAQTATISITGQNDGPTVSGVVTDGGNEDDAVFAVDMLNGASDADTTDVLNVSGLTLSSGDDSSVTIGVNSLSVDPNAYNSLAVGESEVIVYNYNIIDGEGGSVAQTATISITGENDGPTVSGVVTDGGTEDDAVFAVDLLDGASDADTTDVLNVSGLTLSSGDDSGVTIGVNSLSVDPNAYNSLAVGESEVIVYNYNVIDGEGGSVAQTATITISGENDGPTVSGVVTDGSSEDDAVFAVDLLAGASDADTTDVLNVSGLTLSSGDDSGVTIGVNSILVDPTAYNSLAVGESEVIVYNYNIIDGEGGSVAQTATITITGENDGPTISGVVTDGGTEDDAVFAVDLLAGASDADTTDVLNVFGLTLSSGDDSGVTIGVNSNSVDPNAYNSLAVGESEVIIYNYTIIDGEGGSVAQTATITMTGVNDGPISTSGIADDSTGEDALFTLDISGDFSDVDTSDVLTFTAELPGGLPLPSWLSFDGAAGVFTGTPTNSDVASLTIEVTADDGNGGTHTESFVLVVNNTNDDPTDISINNRSIDEHVDTTGDVLVGNLTTTDVDAGDTFTYSIVGGADAGNFTIVGSQLLIDDGVLDFETKNSYDVDIETQDAAGQTFVKSMTISVNDLNDAPTAITPNSFNISESTDTSSGLSLGTLLGADEDSGETFTYAINGGPDASVFTIGGSGDELILNDGILDFETKNAYAVNVRVTDSGGLTHDQAINVTVTDVNEAPVVSLINLINNLTEDTDTSTAIKVADIVIADDALGTNNLSLSGVDAGDFEIIGTELRLKANTSLDFETKTTFDVTVEVDDTALGTGAEDAANHTLNILDVFEPSGIVVTPVAGLITDEAGAIASFDVVLVSAPTASVSIAVGSNDLSEGTTSTSTLIFDATNWNQAQTVMVTGVDDSVDDGDIGYNIVLDAAISADAVYNGLDPNDVSVTNVDDDTAGVVVSTTSVTTNESGTTATFDVSLSSQPLATVTIGVSSNDPTEGIVSTSSLTFDPSNWNVPQTVTVTGQPDAAADGDTSFQIVLSPAVSSDPSFSSLDPADVNVVNNDLAAPVVTTIPPPPDPDPEPDEEEEVVETVSGVPETAPTITEVELSPKRAVEVRLAHALTPAYQKENPDVENEQATSSYWFVDAKPKSVEDQSIENIAQFFSYDSVVASSDLWNDLDNLRERMNHDAFLPTIVVGSVASMASAFTVGYVTWLIRGGQILVGVLARMPAWKLIDPLPILAALEREDDESDDDSLASMVDKSNENSDGSSRNDSRHPGDAVNSEAIEHELAGD